MRLAEIDRAKLVKLLGMLGSNHAGECDAAGLAAHRLIAKRGFSWSDILADRTPERRLPEYATWRITCAKLMTMPDALRPWERNFVADLTNLPRISVKQRYVLTEIAKRVLGDQT